MTIANDIAKLYCGFVSNPPLAGRPPDHAVLVACLFQVFLYVVTFAGEHDHVYMLKGKLQCHDGFLPCFGVECVDIGHGILPDALRYMSVDVSDGDTVIWHVPKLEQSAIPAKQF